MTISIKTIPYNSPDYQKTLALRYTIMRKPLGLNYTPEQLEAESKEHHIAAFHGEEVIASLVLSPINAGLIKMRQVAVKEELQKKGIGTQIVLFCEKWAKANGYKEIVLHARLTAVPFYERLDYKTTGGAFIEVGLPHYKMEKRL